MKRKRICVLPILKDCKGDLSREWYVEYQYRNPKTGQMKRFRVYQGLNGSEKDRRSKAEKIIKKLTQKLQNGWNPFDDTEPVIYEDQIEYFQAARVYGRARKSNNILRKHLSDFLVEMNAQVKPKTYESYQSKIRLFCQWIEKEGFDKNDITGIDNDHIRKFFFFLINERKLDRPTIDKYQQNVNQLFNYLISKRIIKETPVYDIPKPAKRKDMAAKEFVDIDLDRLKEKIQISDPQLWLACLFQYYCAIRPGTELRLLKIGQINFRRGTIKMNAFDAKNQSNDVITIPEPFRKLLISKYQLQDYNPDFYVFSKAGIPGTECLGKNNLRNRFNRIRDGLGLSKEYKFYSWKHAGACALDDNNVPLTHIQNHLRHKSPEYTNNYLVRRRGFKSDEIRNNFPEL